MCYQVYLNISNRFYGKNDLNLIRYLQVNHSKDQHIQLLYGLNQTLVIIKITLHLERMSHLISNFSTLIL